MKKYTVTFEADKPTHMAESDSTIPAPTESQRNIAQQVAKTVKAYLLAAEKLLRGKYSSIKELAPTHLANPGNVIVACCPDGVVVRFERRTEEPRVLAAWNSAELPEVASSLSQSVVHCVKDKGLIDASLPAGTELKLSKWSPATGTTEEIASFKVRFEAVIEQPKYMTEIPSKPFCLLSIRNEFELQILGEALPNGAETAPGQHFLIRSRVRLPVGWECVEVYPFFNPEQWKPEYASIWAEHDLLGAVVAQQYREAQFQSLDPKASARKEFAELFSRYKELLDSNPDREEILQSFLQDHPAMLCPTLTRAWPKLALGARKTDFVFREAAGDYLLVELEKSTHSLFLKDGHASRELNHARGQITDWKRYIEDNLSTVQRELGLTGISTNPNSLIVIGRSQSLTNENRRKLTTIENETQKTKIMTYDDVLENAKAVVENLLGPIWETSGNTEVYYVRSELPS
jgi:hypothetical protein